MGQELQLPDSFKNRQMASAFQTALNATDDNLSDGIGQSYAVIGYRGKVWSLRHRGERKTIIRPDDGTPSGYLDVIILGQAKSKSKSYYKNYTEGDSSPPLCASMDGVVPDADVSEKQCTSCALCPRNVWKTDPTTGRKGRECTDYKRLAVLILPPQTSPIMGGKPLMEPVFLRVPPDSLNSLAIMGETMVGQGYHYSSYITRITFDPQKAHPCMLFRPLQGLTDQEAPIVLELRGDPTVGRITGGDAAAAGLHAVNQALNNPGTAPTGFSLVAGQGALQSTPASSHTAVTPAPKNQEMVTGNSTGLGAAPTATHTTREVVSTPASTSAGLVNTGFGGAIHATQPVAAQGLMAAPVSVADSGEAEASDDELDAHIAGMLTRKS